MKDFKYTIELSYNTFDMDFDHKIEKTIGCNRGGSGFGFGRRDISFCYHQYPAAKRAWNKLRRFKKYDSKVVSYCFGCSKQSKELKQYCSEKCEKEYKLEKERNE